LINLACGHEALSSLESDEGFLCLGSHHAVHLHGESPLPQSHLDLADLGGAYGEVTSAPIALFDLSATSRADRNHGDDLVATIHNDEVIASDEVVVVPPVRIDFDERGGNRYHANALWQSDADP